MGIDEGLRGLENRGCRLMRGHARSDDQRLHKKEGARAEKFGLPSGASGEGQAMPWPRAAAL